MHNNYYFLKHLVPTLALRLNGKSTSSIFSQNKNELVIFFSDGFIIKASLDPSFCCLAFPETFHRAKKNSVNLFEEVIGLEVRDLTLYQNERCFSLDLEQDYRLLFKMHGNRSNVLVIKNGTVRNMFNNSLRKDSTIRLNSLDRLLDQTKSQFIARNGKFQALFPTFGPIIKTHLESLNYEEKEPETKWMVIEQLLKKFEEPNFYLTELNGKVHLSLISIGKILETHHDPIEVLNSFFNYKVKVESFEKEKVGQLRSVNLDITRTKNYIRSNEERLLKLKTETSYSQRADLLMANLHQIPEGSKEVTLSNFYNDNKPLRIKLKKDLSAQKNAENYYRKAKNQHREEHVLQENTRLKEQYLQLLEEQLILIKGTNNLRELRSLTTAPVTQPKKVPKPYFEREFMGYQIWIGKNAKANDTLLRNFSYKDDLWLHAKDAAGSHVIVKTKSGQNIPAPVIEKAAEWAAYNSKRKTDSLCPVIYTPRKFVRKRKGDPPGAVVVDKEKVIMVVPAKD